MIVRLPRSAPETPPETGASTRATPCSPAARASERVAAGCDELMSTTTAPGRIAGSMSASTLVTTAESGSMRTTAAAPSAATAGLAAATAPGTRPAQDRRPSSRTS